MTSGKPGPKGNGDGTNGTDGTEMTGDLSRNPTDPELEAAVNKLIETAKNKAQDEADKARRAVERTGITFEGDVAEYPYTPQEVTEMIEKGCEEIRERYKPIYTPNPEAFSDMIKNMQSVEATMGAYAPGADIDEDTEVIGGGGDLELLRTAVTDMGDWQGDLRDTFVDNYLTPFPRIIATQGGLARFLRQHAQLMRAIYARRRADAKYLAEEAVNAIEAIDDSKGHDLKIALAAIIGVATLVGAGAGMAVALGSAAVIVGTDMGSNFVEEDKKVPLGADTVQGVVDNLFKALDESDKTMVEDEEKVMEALINIEGIAYPMVMGPESGKGTELVPMMPEITKVFDIEDLKDGITVYDRHPGDGDGSNQDTGGQGWRTPKRPT